MGFRLVAERSLPDLHGRVAALRFLDEVGEDSAALVVAVGDVCLGWEPLATRGDEEDAAAEAAAASSDHSLFLRVRTASGAPIVATSLASVPGPSTWIPQDVLLLACEAAIEVYDLHLTAPRAPELLQVIDLAGLASAVLAPSPKRQECLAVAACSDADGTLVLYAFEVCGATARRRRSQAAGDLAAAVPCCVAELRPWVHRDFADGSSASLAHSQPLELLAVGTVGGHVHFYRTNIGQVGPVDGKVDAAYQGSRAEQFEMRELAAERRGCRPALLAWCGGMPFLAVSCRWTCVLVYHCSLGGGRPPELVATLATFTADRAPLRSLAWAANVGVLAAAFEEEWQFWLVEEQEMSQPQPEEAVEDGKLQALQETAQQEMRNPAEDEADFAMGTIDEEDEEDEEDEIASLFSEPGSQGEVVTPATPQRPGEGRGEPASSLESSPGWDQQRWSDAPSWS